MDSILDLIGRNSDLFQSDVQNYSNELNDIVENSRFLVIGGAGTIGQAVTKEIFRRKPKVLHVVDISENNMVELVRDIRSSLGYIHGEFATFAIDCGSDIFKAFMENASGYDYVLNLSALKHVRSEKDPYTLMRMVDVNISNTITSLDLAEKRGASKYFCVSTDKAANPVSMMGASKRIMEMYLIAESVNISVSTARFANVAFSDGSLLYGFNRRLEKNQPLSAPMDVKRYFVTPKESGELCLMSCLLGKNRELFFPKLDFQHNLLSFSDIAIRYLQRHGYEYILCSSEEEARDRVLELKPKRQWPVYFFHSDTTGEKEYEEFYMEHEKLDLERFSSIGVILNEAISDPAKLERFTNSINVMKSKGQWDRNQIIDIFNYMIPEFKHKETGKFLDQRM